jgi:hypothetical protein
MQPSSSGPRLRGKLPDVCCFRLSSYPVTERARPRTFRGRAARTDAPVWGTQEEEKRRSGFASGERNFFENPMFFA